MNLFSPLETFEVVLYYPLNFIFDISITNTLLYLCLIFSSIFLYLYLNVYQSLLIPSYYQFLVESLYKFIVTMVKEQTHKSGFYFFPLFFLVFIFILCSNFIGLFPFSFTVTAQISLTFALAFSFNFGFIILGFLKNGLSFLKLFIPSDAPILLIPLIVVIEIVSYLIRTFSLSIRLFANMMAGHTLLHILTTFSLKLMLSTTIIGLFLSFIPFFLVLAVFVLEFGIALIQAYVFVILLCIYINDSYHPNH